MRWKLSHRVKIQSLKRFLGTEDKFRCSSGTQNETVLHLFSSLSTVRHLSHRGRRRLLKICSSSIFPQPLSWNISQAPEICVLNFLRAPGPWGDRGLAGTPVPHKLCHSLCVRKVTAVTERSSVLVVILPLVHAVHSTSCVTW